MISERTVPRPGQESVWDYLRPPRIEDFTGHISVIFYTLVIADTREAKRVLETSHPQVYYSATGYPDELSYEKSLDLMVRI